MTVRGGIPVATPERLILDLAASADEPRLVERLLETAHLIAKDLAENPTAAAAELRRVYEERS